MKRYFEYCRFSTQPRQFHNNAEGIKADFKRRAEGSGGALYGCWRSLVGLGLARDEGIALSAWPSEDAARTAPPPELSGVTGAQRHILKATVRPTSDAPPTYKGIYVFRWFDIDAQDWDAFRDISDAAWPNMEDVFDVNICGFWRSCDIAEPEAQVLLLTRYADLSVWEASRWWSNTTPEAEASMSRFAKRNEIIKATIAYPGIPIE